MAGNIRIFVFIIVITIEPSVQSQQSAHTYIYFIQTDDCVKPVFMTLKGFRDIKYFLANLWDEDKITFHT